MHLRDEMIETLLLEHEVHVAWPIAMSVQHFEQLANWTIVRDRVRYRNDSLKVEDAVLVALHNSSLVRSFPSWILDIILPVRICFPYVDLDAINGLSLGILDGAEN